MNDIKVLSIGGSRNIGYLSSIRLLDLGASVTFLLRKPTVFDSDETIQKYVRAGKAKLIQGDALVKEDVKRAWTVAQGDDSKPVDYLIFTVGGIPQFKLSKGFVMSPLNLVTQSMLNCLETIPTPHPKIIAVSSAGLTRGAHRKLPLLLKPLYSYALAVPHVDKRGMEEVVAHCAGWEWKAEDSTGASEVLPVDWKTSADLPEPGTLKDILVARPALYTDGECRGDTWEPSSTKGPYKAEEGDLAGVWTISRKDVAHFLVERVIKNWDEWKGKRVVVAY